MSKSPWFAGWLSIVSIALVSCSAIASPAPTRVIVRWTTASEINTAGFNLYRSERVGGPYTKINPQLIPASTDPVVGSEYTYEDTDVMPGKTYYYQLEDVEFSGTMARHGPVAVTALSALGMGDAPTLFALGVGAAVALGAVYLAARRRGRR